MALTAEQMIQKVGGRKFVEMVVNSPKNGKTGAEKDRGIKGRIRFRRCEHGVWIIDNYEPKSCSSCNQEVSTKPRDFKPGFNIGLGCWVESRSEEKQMAKRMGFTEAG